MLIIIQFALLFEHLHNLHCLLLLFLMKIMEGLTLRKRSSLLWGRSEGGRKTHLTTMNLPSAPKYSWSLWKKPQCRTKSEASLCQYVFGVYYVLMTNTLLKCSMPILLWVLSFWMAENEEKRHPILTPSSFQALSVHLNNLVDVVLQTSLLVLAHEWSWPLGNLKVVAIF